VRIGFDKQFAGKKIGRRPACFEKFNRTTKLKYVNISNLITKKPAKIDWF
jgi:hypothetical protein